MAAPLVTVGGVSRRRASWLRGAATVRQDLLNDHFGASGIVKLLDARFNRMDLLQLSARDVFLHRARWSEAVRPRDLPLLPPLVRAALAAGGLYMDLDAALPRYGAT
jgi:hypothetical protein